MSKPNITMEQLIKVYLETKDKLHSNIVPEFEIKFGTKGIKHISKIDFDNVIQKLLSHSFELQEDSNYYLRISLDKIRVEIIGLEPIQEYCRTNNLKQIVLPNHNYNFIEKKPYMLNDPKTGQFKATVDNDDFNFRASYNNEIQLDPESTQIKRLINNWNNQDKYYRLIRRFKMKHKLYPLSIDLSIVRESNINTLRESQIFNKNFKYEIEIELDNNKINSKINTIEELNKMFKLISKYILSGLQQTNFPISYPEQNQILNEYLKLFKGEKFKDVKIGYPKDFIGPSSYTLQMANIAPINPNFDIVNIRKYYTVTDKADGDRKLLYISKIGKIYLITTGLNIEFTGAVTKNKDLFYSLLDGEHIRHNKNGKFINMYAAFDIYFRNNKDVRAFKFIPTKDNIHTNFRLPLLNLLINNLNPLLIGSTAESTPIKISSKNFYIENEQQSIFRACNIIQQQIEQNYFDYNTDGLIFTPTNLGVGLDSDEDTLKSYKTTWKYSLKWKPAEYNTIDFLVTIKKSQTGADLIGNIFQPGLDTRSLNQILQYKTVELRVGFSEEKHGYINPCENIINDRFNVKRNLDNEDSYKPVQFFPTNPYDPEAGLANIPLKLDSQNIDQMFTENGEIIEDNTIVEFKYDLKLPKEWRWVPLRIRYDKTAELRSGQKNYGNAYHVAQSNWHTIHNPITLEMITTGENISEEIDNDDIYYNKIKGTTYTRSLRDFHNLYVKRVLVKSVSNPGDTLIDYAVGKGGDIPKWIAAKLQFVLGIDLSRDNINNRLDGACARYLNYKKKTRNIPDALFIQGNSGKNIRGLEAQFTEKGKIITKAIFGEGAKDESLLGKGVIKSYGVVNNGFNISSIQFALHYLFENMDILQNFLVNIAECTQLNGYLIGTGFDGNKIFDKLKDVDQNDVYRINDENDNKLLEITKLYDYDKFNANISSLGYGINVFQESINKSFTEYLINYEYFERLLENFGFVRLNREEYEKINLPGSVGSFRELFDMMVEQINRKKLKVNDVGTALDLSISEKEISFLNNYFVFKKIRNVDIKDVLFSQTLDTEQTIKKGNLPKESQKEEKAELDSVALEEAQASVNIEPLPVTEFDKEVIEGEKILSDIEKSSPDKPLIIKTKSKGKSKSKIKLDESKGELSTPGTISQVDEKQSIKIKIPKKESSVKTTTKSADIDEEPVISQKLSVTPTEQLKQDEQTKILIHRPKSRSSKLVLKTETAEQPPEVSTQSASKKVSTKLTSVPISKS